MDQRARRRGLAAAAVPLGVVAGCIFSRFAIETLNAAGCDETVEINSVSNPVMDASFAADMVVRLRMAGTAAQQFEVTDRRGALPRLPGFRVSMCLTPGPRGRLAEPLAERLRTAFDETEALAAE